MPEKIRLVQVADLIQLQQLYKDGKTVSELNWLLQDPDDESKLNGFVALNNDQRIVGMIGFVSGVYRLGDAEINGVIPMSWKIADDYKGLAGIQLFRKVMQLGAFSLTIEGSHLAQSVYPLFGLKNIGYSHTCMRLLKPFKYFISLKGRPLIRMIGNFAIMLQSYMKSSGSINGFLDIKRVAIEDIDKDTPYVHKEYFEKHISANYIKWLMKCPLNDSLVFEIYREDEFVGYSVCYIKRMSKKISRGRIVYMPNFGMNQILAKELIAYLENYLKMEGCSSIDISAMDENLFKTIISSGFIDYRSKDKPVFIKSGNAIDKMGICFEKWFMQYTEGDKAYRAI